MNNPTQNLLFNCDGSKLFSTNKILRQAVAYAIDTKGLAEGVYGNFGVALKTFGSSKYSDYNKAWDNEPYYEYDLARAKTLLAQAGYPNGGLNLNLLVENGEEFQNMAVIIQGYLVEAGITVRISSYEKAMLNNLFSDPNSFDMILYGYASTDYLVNLWKLPLLASSYNGHTQNFVVDNAMQRLLEQSITPQGHTQANVNTLHNYLKDNMYIYGLVTNYGYVLGNKRINDVVLDSRNMIIPGACSYDFSR
jgi:ABC-type transport system substrate-binding protein